MSIKIPDFFAEPIQFPGFVGFYGLRCPLLRGAVAWTMAFGRELRHLGMALGDDGGISPAAAGDRSFAPGPHNFFVKKLSKNFNFFFCTNLSAPAGQRLGALLELQQSTDNPVGQQEALGRQMPTALLADGQALFGIEPHTLFQNIEG